MAEELTIAPITKQPLSEFTAGALQSHSVAWECLAAVNDFLHKLLDETTISYVPRGVGIGWPTSMGNVIEQDISPPDKPTLPSASISAPTKPALNDITVQRFDIPVFNVPDPSIALPDVPTVSWPTDPGSAPPLDDVVVPTAPSITLPRVPTFDPVAVPNRPEYQTVSFDGVRPDISLVSPGNLFVFSEQPYSSDVLDLLTQKVLNDIRQGGTGLGADAEQAIWDRAKNRLAEDMQVEIDRVTDMFAAMGCSRPSGPMMGAIARAQQEYGRKLSDLDRDILVQQSELAFKNVQQILDVALKLEQINIDLHNKTMQRAFETAKEVADSALKAFEYEIKAHNLQLDQYKTDATVFETKIRANLATLEQYKALIESAKLESDIQSKSIEIYNAQLKGVASLIEIYKSEMEGAKIKSEVQVQKLTAYRSQIEAYVSRVNANVSRFNAYSAQIGGEKAKAEVYADQVQAFTARVKAVEAQASAESAYAKALADANKSIIEGYQADVAKYKADIDYAMTAQGNVVKLFDSEVSGYGQKVKAIDAHNDTQYKKFTSQVDALYRQASIILEEAKQELMAKIESAKVLAETSKAGATVYAQFGAASLAQANYSARVSYDESVNNGSSESATVSTSA